MKNAYAKAKAIKRKSTTQRNPLLNIADINSVTQHHKKQ